MQLITNFRLYLLALLMFCLLVPTTATAQASIGYSPYKNPASSIMVVGKDFTSKHEYCLAVFNGSPNRVVHVAPDRIGHPVGKVHKIRFNHWKWVCVPATKSNCPKVNLLMRSGDFDRNLGTYQTCGSRWHQPTTSHPTFRLCRTNTTGKLKWLELYKKGKTLMQSVFAKPGKTACVTERLGAHQRHERIRVRWFSGRGTKVTGASILTDAVYWKLAD